VPVDYIFVIHSVLLRLSMGLSQQNKKGWIGGFIVSKGKPVEF
jgi:hypothetical protein